MDQPMQGVAMQSSELSFYTTDELIQELMRRHTFYGCIVHSAEEHRRDDWYERTFRVHFNRNLDHIRASRLLDTVAEHLELHLDETE
jgi:hypothetical protein